MTCFTENAFYFVDVRPIPNLRRNCDILPKEIFFEANHVHRRFIMSNFIQLNVSGTGIEPAVPGGIMEHSCRLANELNDILAKQI